MSVHSSATTLPGSRGSSPERAPSPTRAPSIPIEDDESTANEEELSDTSSIHQAPQDRNPLGWRNLRVPDEETKSIYEAWSIIFVRPTMELRSKTRFLGIDVKTNYVALKDRYSGYRAEPSYTQSELEELVSASRQQYEDATSVPKNARTAAATTTTTMTGAATEPEESPKRSKRLPSLLPSFLRTTSSHHRRAAPTYAQDLSSRLFALPDDLPQKIGVLMDNRFTATNKNQHVHREWKVVMLKELDDWAVVDPNSSSASSSSSSLPVPPSSSSASRTTNHFFRRQRKQQSPPSVQKWLLVFRGQETKRSDSGFEAFESFSNPWLKIDERAQRMRLEGGEEAGRGERSVPPRAPIPPPNHHHHVMGMGGGGLVRHGQHPHPHLHHHRGGPPPPGALLRVPLRAG